MTATSAAAKLTVVKAANPMKAKAKAKVLAVKYAKLKKKNQVIGAKKAFVVKGTKGTLVYKKAKGPKQITVAKSGKITVKKGLKRGVYTLKVKVTAKGNANYKPRARAVTLKLRVK